MRTPLDPKLEVPEAGLEVYRDDFLASRRLEIAVLKSALSIRDFKAVIKLAHNWKGFAAPYGFGHLASLAKELEESATAAQDELCQSLVQEVEEYLGSHAK